LQFSTGNFEGFGGFLSSVGLGAVAFGKYGGSIEVLELPNLCFSENLGNADVCGKSLLLRRV
jgi:hypothetical protein